MRIKTFALTAVLCGSLASAPVSQVVAATQTPALAVGPQYDTTHVYVSPDSADAFILDFVAFAHGKIVSDDRNAPGVEIGRPTDTYRRVRIESAFGRVAVLVTDGHLPYPYGREVTGYEVSDLSATIG